MTLNELVDYLIDLGPYEEPPTPDSEEATPPPSLEEYTKESENEREPMAEEYREDSEDEGESEEDSEEDPLEEEERMEEDPEEDPKKDPEEDPEEDPKEDPEGGSEISEGQLMSAKDLEGDQGEEERNHPAQDNQASSLREVEQRTNSLWGRAEREVGMNCWKRGKCGRMYRATCPLDNPNH